MSTLLTASILLLLLWPAYALLLRYSDRYALNRFLLVLGMMAVCILPFVSFDSPAPAVTKTVRGSIAYVEQSAYRAPVPAPAEVMVPAGAATDGSVRETISRVEQEPAVVPPLSLVYYGGVGLMLLLLVGRLLFLLALHLRSRPDNISGYRLLHPDAAPGQAFTFGNTVYFSRDVPMDPDFAHILNHESVHARQFHTLDIMLMEIFLCFFWFHPAAWWLRNQLRANLEYLVDKAVVKAGADRRNYQLALVRQSVVAQGLALALPFSEPSLKSRISRLTGLPSYRAIGMLAAVALTFWMGVAMVVLNGDSGADAGAKEYLTAMAGPGDPYYDHYQAALAGPVTSFELFTNRMVTIDEYLQIRAILAKVPGTQFYLYKQPFDNNYSLELRRTGQPPATIHGPAETPTKKFTYLLGLKQAAGKEGLAVTATQLERGRKRAGRKAENMTYLFTEEQSASLGEMMTIATQVEAEEVMVFVNGERVFLNAREKNIRAGGIPVADLGPFAWGKLKVEGRQIASPRQRLMEIVGKDGPTTKMKIHRTDRRTNGTYRQWFEKLGLHNSDETGMARRYNDRFARLGFLLDTDFGPNSMIQVAYRTDQPGSMILVQVIDDTPRNVIDQALTDDRTHTLNLYFKRLPTPEEIEHIRPYLSGFPGYDLLLYQSCTDRAGHYTLHLGRQDQSINGYSDWEAGGVFTRPRQLQLTRYGQAGVSPLIPGSTEWPEGAPNRNVALEIDGKWIGIEERATPFYDDAKLDRPVNHESLRCKIGLKPGLAPGTTEWTYIYRSTDDEMMDNLEQTLVAAKLAGRLREYYLGEEQVSLRRFAAYRGRADAYVQIGAVKSWPDGPVVFQIIE